MRRGSALLVVGMVVAAVGPGKAADPVDFTRDVQPILASRCVRCHGPRKAEGGLRLDRRRDALAGGNSGAALDPGKSAASRLIRYVSGQDPERVMPPSGPRLTAAQVAALRAWIDAGARWPDDASADTSRTRSDHWAFQPVRRPDVPAVKEGSWPRNHLDRFILARLEAEGLTPSPEADRVTLIRRLSLDLLGLPPRVADVDAFLADDRPGAYERLVDRLLASPHYGERWARHWLDAARYADSDGYNADSARPIWKYRDWVIQTLNADLPFDRFAVEQMAGDLLPDATEAQRVATGFHRNTLFNAEGGNDPEEFRVERVVDRVATTGTVFLGLSLGCAECHSHKYDPVSQREFYQLYAFFNSAEEATLESPTPEESRRRAAHRQAVARLEGQLPVSWMSPPSAGGVPTLMAAALHTAEVERMRKKAPPVTSTLVLASAPRPRPTHVHLRGSFRRPGVAVTPDVPEVFPPLRPRNADGPPDRLDLARWLVAPENPLTARVAVNRAWQGLFGLGLVETENDFGTQGSPPSHPELLDWLAAELMSDGWSVKRLHRRMVTSATYRQASFQRADLAAVDPRNRLLARQSRQRLEAESVRDVLLASGGLLAPRIGGPSVFPHQPAGVMELRRSPTPWAVSPGPERFRRGLYTHFWRVSPHPFLVTFDAPRADASCTRRTRSNTPLQALMLLDDQAFVECARGLARRALAEESEDDRRLRHAFRLGLAREPTPTEQRVLTDLLARQRDEFRANPSAAAQLTGDNGPGAAEHAAWVAVARVLMNLDEAITRE